MKWECSNDGVHWIDCGCGTNNHRYTRQKAVKKETFAVTDHPLGCTFDTDVEADEEAKRQVKNHPSETMYLWRLEKVYRAKVEAVVVDVELR